MTTEADRNDMQRLRARITELEAECDAWQKKLTEDAWPEIERLRAALRERVLEGHWPACKISIGRCNCSYEDAVKALSNG